MERMGGFFFKKESKLKIKKNPIDRLIKICFLIWHLVAYKTRFKTLEQIFCTLHSTEPPELTEPSLISAR